MSSVKQKNGSHIVQNRNIGPGTAFHEHMHDWSRQRFHPVVIQPSHEDLNLDSPSRFVGLFAAFLVATEPEPEMSGVHESLRLRRRSRALANLKSDTLFAVDAKTCEACPLYEYRIRTDQRIRASTIFLPLETRFCMA